MSNFVTKTQFEEMMADLVSSSFYKINDESPGTNTFEAQGMTLIPLWVNGDLRSCVWDTKIVYPASVFPAQTLELTLPISIEQHKTNAVVGLYITCCIESGSSDSVKRPQAVSFFVPYYFIQSIIKAESDVQYSDVWHTEPFVFWGTGNTASNGTFCLRRFQFYRLNNKLIVQIGPGYGITKGNFDAETGSDDLTAGTYEINSAMVPLIIQGVLANK